MMRLCLSIRSTRCPRAFIGLCGAVATLALSGCGGDRSADVPPSSPFQGKTVVVGILGDPAIIPSIKAQRGEWSARTGVTMNVLDEPLTVEGLAKTPVDILVFPGERMGDLVDLKVLTILPDSAVIPAEPTSEGNKPPAEPPKDELKYKDIVLGVRDNVVKYGPDRMALPIGCSALVVAFHRSAFDNPANRDAAKAQGLALEPPKTWEQFDALARFFHGRDWDGDGQPESGVALAWGPDPGGTGDAAFLARVAALGLHPDEFSFLFDSETTVPRVTSPPFVEGLKAFVDLKAFGPTGAGKFDADASRKAFRSGEVALLIDRAERAGSWGTEGDPIGTAQLPGSSRVFDFGRSVWAESKSPNRPSYLPSGGGWLVGVVDAGKEKGAAEDFVKYLAGPDSTNRLRSEKGFPMLAVRASQLTQGMVNPRSAPGVETRPWADAVSRTLSADRVIPGPRFPGATAYLADLSKARSAAVDGQSPEAALDLVAKSWAERTRSLGQARQTWHHRRSLNGLITDPEPPAR